MSEREEHRSKGFTEALVELEFGQTVGETQFLAELLKRRGLDLSTDEGQEFLSRFVVGQLKANQRLARGVDELKDELQNLRVEMLERTRG